MSVRNHIAQSNYSILNIERDETMSQSFMAQVNTYIDKKLKEFSKTIGNGIISSPTAPLVPKTRDIWIDTGTNAIYRWSGTVWELSSIINQNDNTRTKTWIGTAAEYALLTPDANTLYFTV